ncbi:S-adenosyl-L-methionine-dependent methyltransferase [Mrakia frigida]|uniref:class I SAM-dependent methyltransferase n=1 Tax=Mrakia frigida TaxID=29902 RepID=UPI003FCC0EB9
MDMDAASDATYDSLQTVTPSLAELIIEKHKGNEFSGLNQFYPLPYNDEVRKCEAIFHELVTTLTGGDLYFEPELEEGTVAEILSKKGTRVLDLGCGMDGLWCTSMATRFPSAEVIGVDLFPVSLEFAPPNTEFHVFDVHNGLPFDTEYFDVVHVRGATLWLKTEAIINEIRRVLRVGGVFLLLEFKNLLHRADGTIITSLHRTVGENVATWVERFDHLTHLLSINISPSRAEETGGELLDVQEKTMEVHLGTQSSLNPSIQWQKAGKLYRESLVGYLGVQVFQYGIGGFSEERKVASMGPLKQLISLLTPEDSNIWDTVKMIFARKGTEPSMPTGQQPGRLTVEDALNKLVEARPGFEGPLRL